MKSSILRCSLLAVACLVTTPLALAGDSATLHVPAQFARIQAAIDVAQPGDTVIVADGVYSGLGNRNLRFEGKAITLRSANGPEFTTINVQGTPTEPHRGFLFNSSETRETVLEGFTITGGATLPGAVADQFNGGAVRIQAASPTIRNCHFVGNQAGCWGAAVYVGDATELGSGVSNPLIENCLFLNNAADDEGGGFFSWGFGLGSSTTIRNSVFMGNSAGTSGGGICTFGGTNLVLENVTITNNVAPTSANALLGETTVTHSILWTDGADAGMTVWGQNSFTYSMVKGGMTGVGNVDVDPLFAVDGFHLLAVSPLVNAGLKVSPAAVAGQTDIDGQPRQVGSKLDIGADEVTRGHRYVTTPGPMIKN